MKKIVSLIIALIFLPAVYVQAQSDSQVAEVLVQIEQGRELTSRYKLYQAVDYNKNPTRYFVSLDTQTGKMDVIDGNHRVTINAVDLTNGNGKVSDIFELQANGKGYEFILYCKVNGAAWSLYVDPSGMTFKPITAQ